MAQIHPSVCWVVIALLHSVSVGAAAQQPPCKDRASGENPSAENSAPQSQASAPLGVPLVPGVVLRPEPLTAEQKLRLALRRGMGPTTALSSFAVAGYQQALDKKSGYGQGAEGYFSRVGSSYGTGATKHFLGSFLLASIFRQDPRYFPSERKSFGARLSYALKRTLVTRGDNGRVQFNISTVGGAFGAGLISNAWHEPPDRGLGRGVSRGAVMVGTEALRNVFREFWPDIRRKLRH